jgi:hypothetical protein
VHTAYRKKEAAGYKDRTKEEELGLQEKGACWQSTADQGTTRTQDLDDEIQRTVGKQDGRDGRRSQASAGGRQLSLGS